MPKITIIAIPKRVPRYIGNLVRSWFTKTQVARGILLGLLPSLDLLVLPFPIPPSSAYVVQLPIPLSSLHLFFRLQIRALLIHALPEPASASLPLHAHTGLLY